MGLQNYSLTTKTTSLDDLLELVQEQENLYLPDFLYSGTDKMRFNVADMGKHLGDNMLPDEPCLHLENGTSIDESPDYLFTDWSMGQLLSKMGVKRRWFQMVTLQDMVSELNKRRHVFDNDKFRIMKSADEESTPFRLIRGMVSKRYADIPNTYMLEVIQEETQGQDVEVIKHLSGITDRAFYVWLLVGDDIGIPGTEFQGRTGILLRNSEVGYSSLRAVPFLATKNGVMLFNTIYRRTHRGNEIILKGGFQSAIKDSSADWSDLDTRVQKLRRIKYSTSQEVCERIQYLVTSVKGTKSFAKQCEVQYALANNTVHTGETLLNAIVKATLLKAVENPELTLDSTFDKASVAGAVLFKLTK